MGPKKSLTPYRYGGKIKNVAPNGGMAQRGRREAPRPDGESAREQFQRLNTVA